MIIQRSAPFLSFFILGVSPPWREIHSLTGFGYTDINSAVPAMLVTFTPAVQRLSK